VMREYPCYADTNKQMWSFARDRAFPFSATWAKVNTKLGVPLNAHIACNCIVVLLGALYIASATGTFPHLTPVPVISILTGSVNVRCISVK
jgi:choline transport protein